MPNSSHNLLNYLRVVVGACRQDARNDAVLLARFAEDRDEAAFAALVWRHGALVWGTCRRILGDTPDAEDAFQTTFLTLARKAGLFSVDSLAGWLHQVARQTALNVHSSAQRRRGLEERLRTITRQGVEEDASRTELYRALDEELVDLPEKLRVPLVLRYLEGKTQNEVAHILGCSRSAALKRLARGEALLRQRLERRGLGVGIGSLAALLGSSTVASAMPAPLAHSTVKAALLFTATPAADGLLSVWGASLVKRVLQTLCLGKGVPLVLGVAVVLAGAGVWAYQHKQADTLPSETLPKAKLSSAATAKEKSRRSDPARPAPDRLDLFGAPLPNHAVARMGMARFRHISHVTSVAYAPDGKTIASASWDKTIRLWDAATGKELRKFQGHEGEVGAVAFAPDGKTLASSSADKTVRLWDAATGKELRRLKGHQQPVTAVAFSPDGNELVSASWDQTVRLWQVSSGREQRRFTGHTARVWAVVFSADGKTLASGDADGIVRLWSARFGAETGKLKGHEGVVRALAFSPDDKQLASGGGDGIIHLWDMATDREIRKMQAQPFPGKQQGVCALAFAPDGKTLVSGNSDWIIRFWDVKNGTELRTAKADGGHYSHLGAVSSLAFSRDGKSLVSGGWDQAIRLWEPSTAKPLQNWEGHKEHVGSVGFAPDGRTLASSSLDNTVRLWDAATGKQLRQLDGLPDSMFVEVAFSSDGKTLATANHEKTVRLWDTTTGKEVQMLEGHTQAVSTVAFSPDGTTLASGDSDGTLRLWNLATGKERRVFRHTAWVSRVAFSPNGKTIASAEWDKGIVLWDVATGRRIGQLEGHQMQRVTLAFSPDGKSLASANWDGVVRVWDVATGKEVFKLEAPEDLAHGVAFAPRGGYLATGNKDGTVRLWEWASGQECQRFGGHDGFVCSVAFSADGSRLASGSGDHTVLVWDLTGQRGKLGPATRLGPEELERLWSDLAGLDASRAYRSGRLLASVPDRAVELLRRCLRAPLKSEDSLRIALEQDSASYPGLEEGKVTEPPASSSKGTVRRGKPPGLVSGENLRIVRAAAVLEWIGTDEAKELLREVTERVRQAQAALDRELGRLP